jgi:hypothetical protein
MYLTYCDGWFHFYKRPGEIWPVERAKRAHDNGELYTVVVGDLDDPECFVDVRLELGYVGVSFFDSRMRVYVSYDFEKQADGRLFLFAAATREYSDDSENPSLVTFYRFSPDGRILIRREYSDGRAETAQTVKDVSGNWEPVPSFGDYEGVTRVERAPLSGMTASA